MPAEIRTAALAHVRERREELGTGIVGESVEELGIFRAEAWGHPSGAQVLVFRRLQSLGLVD